MSNPKALLRTISWVIHGLAALALVLLFLKTQGMTLFCVVPGAIIGGGSAVAKPGRPITLYAAFGLILGYAFWAGASIVNQRAFLEFVPILLLVASAVWMLEAPSLPAALGAGVMVLLCLGVAILQFRRPGLSDYDPELVRKSGLTALVILGLAFFYVAFGYAESAVGKPRSTKRGGRQRRQAPAEMDEDA